jgi:hypothetical protein
VQKKTKIPNDSIPFLERPGESLYEKESRDAEQVLTKERAARKVLAKRKGIHKSLTVGKGSIAPNF